MTNQSGNQKNNGRDPGTIHNRKTKPDSGTGQKAPASKSSGPQEQSSGPSKKNQ